MATAWNKGIKRWWKVSGQFKPGQVSWNKGKKMSEESRRKLSLSCMGRKLSDETKRKISEQNQKENNPFWGRKHTKENIELMRLKKLGNKHSKEVNLKKGSKGEKNGNWGKGLFGELNGRWNGGTSRLPYSIEWTTTLKKSIRERDFYTCQICGKIQSDKSFHVHHIDYDKKNCDPSNLITLCHSCHAKTNSKRDYWIIYFKKNG